MIRETLSHIATQYLTAKQEPFTGHPLAHYLRQVAPDAIAEALENNLYLCRGSAGQSDWADVPWLGVYNPNITTTATEGYYVVYLFAADMGQVHLGLAQGTTKVREEFGRSTHDVLRRFAGIMRDRLPEAKGRFSPAPVALFGTSTLAKDYEPSVALSATYSVTDLPAENVLRSDLQDMARFYSMLFARGGRDTVSDGSSGDENGDKEPLIEQRRYRQHRKLERNPKVGRAVKNAQGYICKCCGFDFAQVYGPAGEEYIEAHHLTPLAQLPEGVPVSQDPVKDFAVLCANCHRIIHRKDGPKTIAEMRSIPSVATFAALLKSLS